MKKHIVLIMNIVLIALVVGAIVFTVFRALNGSVQVAEPTVAAVETASAQTGTEVPVSPGERYRIGIVQNGAGVTSDNCYAGFISELNERGLLEQADVTYVLEDDKKLCKEKIQRLVDGGCDLLYTIGAFASKAAADITTEVPIVFGAVTDPGELGLVKSNEFPGGNITGVSSYTPCFEQIDLIPLLLPQAKSVGALYYHTDEDAMIQAIIASKEAENIHLTCNRIPVSDEASLRNALDTIKTNGDDVIYVPSDQFIEKNIGIVTAFSAENGIPIICGDEATLEQGAFATSGINYTSIGRKAAGIAYDILYQGMDPSSLPVIYKYDCYHKVNDDVRVKLGILIPDAALEQVELISYLSSVTEDASQE